MVRLNLQCCLCYFYRHVLMHFRSVGRKEDLQHHTEDYIYLQQRPITVSYTITLRHISCLFTSYCLYWRRECWRGCADQTNAQFNILWVFVGHSFTRGRCYLHTTRCLSHTSIRCFQPLVVDRVLMMPLISSLGEGRLPSQSYPSDHLSMITDFNLIC